MGKRRTQRGNIEAFLIGVLVVSIFLAGGLIIASEPGPKPGSTLTALGLCCDSGNGENCRPITDAAHPPITFNGTDGTPQQYGLLKTGMTMFHPCHIEKTNQTYNGQPIIVNKSEHLNECGGGTGEQDQLDDLRNYPGSHTCYPYRNDAIIFVCKSGCFDSTPEARAKYQKICGHDDPAFTMYGDETTVYDAYFRLADYPTPGIPDPIKYCKGSQGPVPTVIDTGEQEELRFNFWEEHKTLQLHTFDFVGPSPAAAIPIFIQPWCKPAVYLYPEKEQEVTVKLETKQSITYTDPVYPETGWKVLAKPDGTIISDTKKYDYLYYEAAIPDNLIPKEQTGYVVAYDKLESFFEKELPKSGLNTKEQQQFTEYWLQVLPKSPFYKITFIEQKVLDTFVSLLITPKPDTMLRVTAYFEPLEKPEIILPPAFSSVTRKGFTVVEWAGLYKKHKNDSFTCLQ